MISTITCTWQENLAFVSQLGDHGVRTDASPVHGGDNSGASPKSLMLAALAGCTGVDVVALLVKMRMEFAALRIVVEAELTEEVPAVYRRMHLIYQIEGDQVKRDKVMRAVQLSQDKYCGVSAMYRRIMEISWEVIINGEKVV
jgi:putative redox protein